MKRRRVLAALGAVLPIVGCLSADSRPVATDPGSNGSTATGTPAHTDTPTSTAFSLGEPNDDVNPHGLTVRNDGDTTRTAELRIIDADTDEPLLNQSYTLAGGGAIRGELHGPAEYGVRVAVPASGTDHATTVGYFDTCNDYGTTVTIAADGSITSETFSTLLECPDD